MAQVIGMRTGYHSSSGQENSAVRDVRDRILYRYPQASALLTIISNLKQTEETKATKFEWPEKSNPVLYGQIDGSTYTAGATSIGVVDGTAFKPGSLFVLPGAITSAVQPELVRVTAVSTNTLTVVRGVGGTTANAIAAADPIVLAGSAYEEGGDQSSARNPPLVMKYNYVEIFKDSASMSNTQQKISTYGTRNQFQTMKEEVEFAHKVGINNSLYFGAPSESLTGGPNGRPIRTTGGLMNFIATNVMNANGALSLEAFTTWLRINSEYTSMGKSKIIFASPILQQALNMWGINRLQVSQPDKIFGVTYTEIAPLHGISFKVVQDWTLKDHISGKNGFAGHSFIVDPTCVRWRTLRDTHWVKVDPGGQDSMSDEIRTEGGWEINNEERHGRLYGMTGFIA